MDVRLRCVAPQLWSESHTLMQLEGLPNLAENSDQIAQQVEASAGLLGQGLMVAGLLTGVTLLLLGRKLIRPACAVTGLVIGGLATAAIAVNVLNVSGNLVIFCLVGGAIVFGVVAWFLYRLWMGVACALLLALVAPTVAIMVRGDTDTIKEGIDPATVQVDANQFSDVLPDEGPLSKEAGKALWEKIQAMFEPVGEQVRATWDNLGSAGRTTVLSAAGIGALVGLLLGLIAPNGAAMLQSSIVASILIVGCGFGLAYARAPETMERANVSQNIILIALAVITVHGIGIQWTLFRRKDDK